MDFVDVVTRRRTVRRFEEGGVEREYLAIPAEYAPIGVMPVGRPLPDVRSPSLKRGWVPFDEFARWEQWDG